MKNIFVLTLLGAALLVGVALAEGWTIGNWYADTQTQTRAGWGTTDAPFEVAGTDCVMNGHWFDFVGNPPFRTYEETEHPFKDDDYASVNAALDAAAAAWSDWMDDWHPNETTAIALEADCGGTLTSANYSYP